jgi:hypothetical protein
MSQEADGVGEGEKAGVTGVDGDTWGGGWVLMWVAGVLLVGDGERANGERADWESGETIKYLRMFIQFGTLNGLQYSGPRQTLTVHTERPWCSVGYKSASQYDQTLERPRM